MGLAIGFSDIEALGLIHVAWLRWYKVRDSVYGLMGVRNTEELIRHVVDVDRCCPRDDELRAFLNALKRVVSALGIDVSAELRKVLDAGMDVIPFFSRRYPCELLRYRSGTDFIYPPLVLYARGLRIDLNSRLAIAIVGTRECSDWGRSTAYELGKRIAERGYMVVTGLAKGIDASATLGALDGGGFVVGVRPWLEPLSLPFETRRIVEKWRDRIAIVSENPFKPKAFSRHSVAYLYYLRNRIIAGMSRVVVVVEARFNSHSGSMHQIELALKRGKHVVILRHPLRGSVYWRAYEKYVSMNAIEAKDVDDAIRIIEELARG